MSDSHSHSHSQAFPASQPGFILIPTQSQPQSQPNKQDLPFLPPHYQYHGITYIVGTLEK